LTNPIISTVSTQNPYIEPFVHIVGFEAYFDSTVAMSFVHCEVKNILERHLDRMNKPIIKVTITTGNNMSRVVVVVVAVAAAVAVVVVLVVAAAVVVVGGTLPLLLFIIHNYILKTNHVPRKYNVIYSCGYSLWYLSCYIP
jgi:hypothetical protein